MRTILEIKSKFKGYGSVYCKKNDDIFLGLYFKKLL